MKFRYKADYKGDFDSNGIPLLNYHGNIGLQYNPIAIAQYGLGNYNLFLIDRDKNREEKFYKIADWLCDNLKENKNKIPVWFHFFDFEYKITLKSPWYSGLAQGMGISLLLRAYYHSNNDKYKETALSAYKSFEKSINEGGVIFKDSEGSEWIEEYIVLPPTHILNGFIWALFGVYDLWKFTGNQNAENLFFRCLKTLNDNLYKYDVGYWSKYELTEHKIKMIASPFYHDLHIIQLLILYRMTKNNLFYEIANKWSGYKNYRWNRFKAIIEKSIFKLLYY